MESKLGGRNPNYVRGRTEVVEELAQMTTLKLEWEDCKKDLAYKRIKW
jgi:hypothetical protein